LQLKKQFETDNLKNRTRNWATEAQERLTKLFPAEELVSKEPNSREKETEVLGRNSEALQRMMVVTDRPQSSSSDVTQLRAVYTIFNRIYKFGISVLDSKGATAKVSDLELSRYLGFVTNTILDINRMMVNKGNMDRLDYISKVMGQVGNITDNLFGDKSQATEAIVKYKLGGVHVVGKVAKYGAYLVGGLALFNSIGIGLGFSPSYGYDFLSYLSQTASSVARAFKFGS